MKIQEMMLLIIAVIAFSVVHAKESHTTDHQVSKYAGEQNRSIKSLSESDIEELQNGSGWGLAKAAELNGVPGPLHLLELEKEIGLSKSQKEQIQLLFNNMKTEAIATGQKLIEQEQLLEERFRNDIPDSQELQKLLNDIGATRSKLRFVHLDTHLKTPEILSTEQIAQYNKLRGYANTDPCKNIPEGHSVEMWKKHNGCE